MHRQMGEIGDGDVGGANDSMQLAHFVMGTFEKFIDQAQLEIALDALASLINKSP
jgi:hypothetical protein